MKLEMSLKKNVVGGLKFWKYFRARFAEARPLGYPAWSYRHMVPPQYFFSHLEYPATLSFLALWVRRVGSSHVPKRGLAHARCLAFFGVP